MKHLNRRKFVGTTAGLSLMTVVNGAQKSFALPANGADALKNMPLGIIKSANDPDVDLAKVRELGFGTCQLSVGDYSKDHAQRVKTALRKYTLEPTCLICMGPGKYIWNFYEGPSTIGLVPREYRTERVVRLKEGIEFCKEAGISAVLAHFGFIPENPNDVLYGEFIDVMKVVAGYAGDREIEVRFETGQETPVTLLRAIEDIGTDNLGVNYDTANLILYGKANPVDGLDVVGRYVRSLHAKDGLYPTDPKELGHETPIGEGAVDFPNVIRKLKALNFTGHITIEREISGPKKIEDILKAKRYLEELIRTV
ncbi:MAG: sugar phosphate isomerase/epimerase [Candidatus Latescibacteria bacterium]|nr:sugar phosphate isomerase/epimerase [Candidatus Latescibacterota bacterium]